MPVMHVITIMHILVAKSIKLLFLKKILTRYNPSIKFNCQELNNDEIYSNQIKQNIAFLSFIKSTFKKKINQQFVLNYHLF